MLFFRSEERVREWCRERGCSVKSLVRIDQLWALAQSWYGSRLRPDSRRPAPEEMSRIFARLGLDDAFWDPRSDRFGAPQ